MAQLLDFLQGKNQSIQNIPRFNPQQMQFQDMALQQAQQGLGTDAIENKARAGFQRDTVPLLSERFANIGGKGLSGIGSSGYQNAIQGAGSELELGLADLRQRNALNLANIGLTPQNEQVYEQAQPAGFGQGLATGVANSLPQLAELGGRGLASYFGNNQSQTPSILANATQAASPLAGQIASAGSNLVSKIGTGVGAAGAGLAAAGSGLLSGLGSVGSSIGAGLSAAAPFALPLAAGASVLALPFILSRLLED